MSFNSKLGVNTMAFEALSFWPAMRRWGRELGAIGLVVGFIAILVFGVYLKTERPVATAEYIGTLEGVHQIQGNTGSNVSVFFVRLPNGELIRVTPPEMTPFTNGARVRVFERTGESGRKTYSFAGYVSQ